MRKLTTGNKINFTVFMSIILIILLIIIIAVIIGLKNQNEKYQITSSSCIYDKDYKYIELSDDGVITKKWTGQYYLEELSTKKEYQLGNYAILYEKLRKSFDLFGTFYQIKKGGSINKINGHNIVSSSLESRFYKIDDRKYLIISKEIKNDTGLVTAENYLIVIVDKLGNALLLNDKINSKTINEMLLITDEFTFDVANEILKFEDEDINLKKIIGSTNEYVPKEEIKEEEEAEEKTEEDKKETPTIIYDGVGDTTTTTNINNSTTIIQTDTNLNNNGNDNNIGNNSNTNNNGNNTNNSSNNNNSSNSDNANKQDTSWVEPLNNWMNDVAAGFESIYNDNKNSSSNKKEETGLNRSITLNSLSVGTTALDINYTVIDPENKYNIVYATISSDTDTQTISLNKNDTVYRVTGLEPNTNYVIDIGYKIIYSDANSEEVSQDSMLVRTKSPTENLTITRVTVDKIYFNLKLDSSFVYDPGCKIVVYINDTTKYLELDLTEEMLETAAVSGYVSSFKKPEEYKTIGNSITIELDNTTINGEKVNTNLVYKIVNY